MAVRSQIAKLISFRPAKTAATKRISASARRTGAGTNAQDAVRDLILAAYAEFEQAA